MGFCCLSCMKTGHCNGSWVFLYHLPCRFPSPCSKDKNSNCMDPGTCKPKACSLFLLCIRLLWDCYLWEYLAAILLWVSLCSGFSAFQSFFLLLPVKCWSIPSCVLSLRDCWAAVNASVRSRTPPRLQWAQMKGDSLCKGRKISSHKSLLMLNIVGFCLAQLWKLNTDWKSSYQGIMVGLKSQKPDGLRYIYASCYRHVSTALECEEV